MTEPNTENEVTTQEKQSFSDEEIQKILNTAKATRTERDEAARKAAEIERQNQSLQAQLEQVKAIDPKRVEELETLAAQYEERKLEEQRQFSELKERWSSEKNTLAQEIGQLKLQNRDQGTLNQLEKAFNACGGRDGKDEDGYSYFDLVRDRALKFVQYGDDGKPLIIDPRDGTRLRTDKGAFYTFEDLMFKLRQGGPTASLFDPIGNGAGGGMQGNGRIPGAAARDSVLQIKDRAERLARARELGIK